jgi:small subunit ribosomal protein S13
MARIAGVNIPTDKRIVVAITYIFGIGPSYADRILAATKVNPETRVKDLTESEISRIRDEISANYQVEGDLQRSTSVNVKRLKEIGSYRGLRHKANLPSRGQRTKTNARTRRGKKVTMGSGRKKAAAKT